ncbi:MAG: nuclease-related domain-containing protein, partial [Gammaproteobacteria bacterium]
MRDFDFSERWLIAGIAVTVGVLVGIGVTVGWRWYRQYRERQRRRRLIEAVSVDHLRDVALPDGSGGLLHVDYLLLTARGLLILDVRDVIGNVFGSDPMVEWTVMQGARRFTFANPQGAMYDRIAALTVLAGDLPIDGRIVFGPGAV